MQITIKKEYIIVFYGFMFFAIIGAVIGYYSNKTVCNGPMDAFAKCISSKGFTMYGRETCGWCQMQMKEFGYSFKYITYIDCNTNAQACAIVNITGTPTWIHGDQKIESMLTIGMLEQLTNCSAG